MSATAVQVKRSLPVNARSTLYRHTIIFFNLNNDCPILRLRHQTSWLRRHALLLNEFLVPFVGLVVMSKNYIIDEGLEIFFRVCSTIKISQKISNRHLIRKISNKLLNKVDKFNKTICTDERMCFLVDSFS